MKHKHILHLSDELLIGKGGVRKVYRHPEVPDRCVKITFNLDRQRSVRREADYLRKYWRQRKPFDHLVRFYGYSQTNYGKGGVFELIRDYNGNISESLAAHVAETAVRPLKPAVIVHLLNELKTHLLAHRIIVSDPAPHNLLVQYTAPDKPRLVVIDGIGNPHFIKLADYSAHHAHQIICKKWRYYVDNHTSLKKIFTFLAQGKTAA